MRRLFTIFLLVLLPLQLSWASVAAYCQHEADGQAQHFGHHEHEHQASQTQDDADSKLSGGIDNDCGACNAGYVVAILGDMAVTPSHLAAVVVADYRPRLSLSPLEIPERPNWAVLA
jgi:hypothetical protein